MRDPKRVAILISGRGSNMRVLVEQAEGAYEIGLIASNKPAAAGLEWARERGLATWAAESKGVAKEQFDREISLALDEARIGTIALAGYMRILSPWFVGQWRGRISTSTRPCCRNTAGSIPISARSRAATASRVAQFMS